MMHCQRFLDWLDRGCAEGERARAETHAAGCAYCADSYRESLELDALLAAPPPPAPAAFADGVLARVRAEPRRAPALAPVPAPALPWWVEVARQPTVIAAFLLLALVFWRDGAIFGLAASAYGSALAGALEGGGRLAARFFALEHPISSGGAALALLPAAALLFYACYRGAERLVLAVAGPRSI